MRLETVSMIPARGRRFHVRLLIAVALLASCRDSPAPDATTNAHAPAASPAAEPAQPAGDLFGEWQVAALDSARLTAAQAQELGKIDGIAVLVGARFIEAASQCMPYLFEHRRGEERIEVTAKGWPEPVCARMPLPFEGAFGGIVEQATRVERIPSGDIRLTGAAGTVSLRRPEGGRLANPFGNSPAPGARLLWGHFRLLDVNGTRVPAGAPIDVAIGRFWMEARSGCLPFRWSLVRSDATLALRREAWPEPVCEQGHSEVEQALERAMPSVRGFTWLAPYRLRLSGPGGAVTLERVRARKPYLTLNPA
jgi:hypothetical protein